MSVVEDCPVILFSQSNVTEEHLKDVIHERLNKRCELDAETGCWVYCGYWDRYGTGRIRVGNDVYSVQRVAAWIYLGNFELWDRRRVYHRSCCPNPACFNPDHIQVIDGHPSPYRLLRSRCKS